MIQNMNNERLKALKNPSFILSSVHSLGLTIAKSERGEPGIGDTAGPGFLFKSTNN